MSYKDALRVTLRARWWGIFEEGLACAQNMQKTSGTYCQNKDNSCLPFESMQDVFHPLITPTLGPGRPPVKGKSKGSQAPWLLVGVNGKGQQEMR